MCTFSRQREVLESVGYTDAVETCERCGSSYTQDDVNGMMQAMFGTDPAYWNEDYLVQVGGLCPDCWFDPVF